MAAAAGALSEAAARLGRAVATAPQARLESVRALTGLFREAQPREMAEESMFRNLLEILMSTSSEIEQVYKDSCGSVDLHTCLLLVAECFRCLRNACVECAKNQNVMRNLGLISTSVHLIKLLHGIQIKEELLLTALRCSLQFLGNVAAGNGDSQNSIWKCAFPDLFLMCLTYDDQKIVTYCCMVLFNCLNSEKVRELLDPGNLTVTLHVLKVYKEQLETEWSFLIVTDHLLKCPELVEALYAKLSNQERVTLLELMMAKVSEKNPVTSEEMNVFMRHANFLAGCFQEKCEAVLKLTSAADAEDEEALVTIRLLDVLCEMTSNNRQLEHLQALPGLLETAIDTLRLTHLAGKQAVNIFTATHVMTGLEEISHPAVGFKSHLIRLIGNLCYKNKENQDKVYELDGIPLILDNCSIDDNNPCYFMSKSNKKISTLICNRYEDDYGQLRTNFLYPLQRLFERDACQSYSFEILTVDLLINWFCECLNLIGITLYTGSLVMKLLQNERKIFLSCVRPLHCDRVVNQWAVYAIRNLTEQNERNQELIAQMEEKGLADNSALESMGLEIEKRDDKLILRSVRKKPS